MRGMSGYSADITEVCLVGSSDEPPFPHGKLFRSESDLYLGATSGSTPPYHNVEDGILAWWERLKILGISQCALTGYLGTVSSFSRFRVY